MDDDSIEMEDTTDGEEQETTENRERETTGDQEHRVVTEGPFEREVDLSRSETASLLRDLADQIEAGGDLTVGHGDWEVPFSFREPIELEVELEEEDDERELEIELEFEE